MQPLFAIDDVTTPVDLNDHESAFNSSSTLHSNELDRSSDHNHHKNEHSNSARPRRKCSVSKTNTKHNRFASSSSSHSSSSNKHTVHVRLPSAVLTKQNSKIWNDSDFNEYEKELIGQLEHLKATTPVQDVDDEDDEDEVSSLHRHKPQHYDMQPAFAELPAMSPLILKDRKTGSHSQRRRSSNSISFQNYHEWSKQDMKRYEEEMLTQYHHLAEQLNSLSTSHWQCAQ